MRTIKAVSLFVCLSFLTLGAANYFVAENGSNGNDGSASHPWKTIQYAVDHVSPGDTVTVAGGVYNELVAFHVSGSAAAGYIVLQNAANESPVIDGDGLATSSGDMPGMIKIINQNYIKITGFELRNLVVSSSDIFPAGIWIRGHSHHIDLIGNRIHHIEQHNAQAGAHGIGVYGTSSPDSIHDILIRDNEVYDCKLGWSESLVLNGNVSGFTIQNNTIHDNNNIAFDFIGFEGECPDPQLDQARYGQVIGNTAHHIDSRGNPSYGDDASADGFYVDGGRDIILERNTAYQCNIGFELASEHSGKSTSRITMRNNFVYDNTVIGVSIGGYDQYRGTTDDCYIVNNSFFQNNTDNLGWGSEILIQYYCHNNTIKNNIVYAASGKPFLIHDSGTGSDNQFDYNLYYGTGGNYWSWQGSEYTTLSAYSQGSGQEAHSLFDDPLYVDAVNGNLRITPASPAIDKGVNLTSDIVGSVDYDGKERILNERIDMGAIEYDSASTTLKDLQPDGKIVERFVLDFAIYPNPFHIRNSFMTRIHYRLTRPERLTLSIFNALGQKVRSLQNQRHLPAGTYDILWDGRSDTGRLCPSGIYFAILQGKTKNEIKLTVVK